MDSPNIVIIAFIELAAALKCLAVIISYPLALPSLSYPFGMRKLAISLTAEPILLINSASLRLPFITVINFDFLAPIPKKPAVDS